ncbi:MULTISPECIES: rod shape-determining protein MreC [Thalassospira]|uniref:Cell shape-determining protein MreC n=1 Tax=Thalassospira xiamenensis TaxID=220697 RepID=A0ABR5Y716_9PROT|nr:MULTISPECIES: rod shape-determining protein MreC [Thalassospira]MAL30257.1 rod shape-determining protein MreC [Thalassospira sp.]MBR9779111.1 rod shape-determining protein MreC [Rhodospirillales bacterium]KZD07103.1 rod shape-determining protein MreC [Thalassospira xiamenensis]KZD08820.1 rod shape-determining protein MreC [Thalassospira xiamenensis]MBL4839482.1 rod shape-determining protein MreC [Thalassospira sp.]
MAQHGGPQQRIFSPLRTALHRFAFILLIVSAFGLMLLGKADTVLIERIRAASADLVSPIMNVVSRPAASINELTEQATNIFNLYEQNERLRRENRELLAWQQVARNLAHENARLRDLADYTSPPPLRLVTTRVIADMGGAYAHSLMVSAGSRDGVIKGQAVMSDEGLVGRVAEAGYQASRVLLITDINSRVPVIVENSRDRAFLSGDNTDRPLLTFLTADAAVAPGDRILTSGHGGAFPPGIPVGVVSSVSENAVRVAPLFRRHQLEYLRVADYGLQGILSDQAMRRDQQNDGVIPNGVGIVPNDGNDAAENMPTVSPAQPTDRLP